MTKLFLRAAFVIGVLIVTSVGAIARPPNIVFILADDLGWSDLSCHGSIVHRTHAPSRSV